MQCLISINKVIRDKILCKICGRFVYYRFFSSSNEDHAIKLGQELMFDFFSDICDIVVVTYTTADQRKIYHMCDKGAVAVRPFLPRSDFKEV